MERNSERTSVTADDELETCACSCYRVGCAGHRNAATTTTTDAERQEKLLAAQCAICLDVLYEPVTIACGHTFCASCLLNVADKRCPACRAPFAEYPKINIFIGNWLNKELRQEVSRKRNEYLKELCREVAECAVANASSSSSSEPMFDNERLLRECNRREEQHRRRMRQEALEDATTTAPPLPSHTHAESRHPSSETARFNTHWHMSEAHALREIQDSFLMDVVF